jgi:hypothetical protein
MPISKSLSSALADAKGLVYATLQEVAAPTLVPSKGADIAPIAIFGLKTLAASRLKVHFTHILFINQQG